MDELETIGDKVCEAITDANECKNAEVITCTECLAKYALKLYHQNSRGNKEKCFTMICPNCGSTNVEEYTDYDYGYEEEIIGENHYSQCKDCGFNDR